MTKKTANRGTAGTGDGAAEQRDEVYVAHQVHTLAQMIYRQLAATRAASPQQGMPAVPPAFYWYS